MESDLPSPSFVIILSRCRRNCKRLIGFCQEAGCAFRPHMKTAKSITVGDLQSGGDRSNPIIVSTLAEVRYFAENGFTSILYAVPFEPSKGRGVASILAKAKGLNLSLYVDSEEGIGCVSELSKRTGCPISVFLAVDASGYHREGVDPVRPGSVELATGLADGRFPGVELAGLYSHSGNAYNSPDEARAITLRELDGMVEFCQRMAAAGAGSPPPVVSVGSTPSYCHTTVDDVKRTQKALDTIQWGQTLGKAAATETPEGGAAAPAPSMQEAGGSAVAGGEKAEGTALAGAKSNRRGISSPGKGETGEPAAKRARGETCEPVAAPATAAPDSDSGSIGPRLELHAGNYALFDRQQVASGSCSLDDVACYVLCRVVGRRPDGSVLVDGGGMALHKDSGGSGVQGWGAVLGDPGMDVVKVSQELALLRPNGQAKEVAGRPRYALGDPVRIVPNHSCMTAAMHPVYHFVESVPWAEGAAGTGEVPSSSSSSSSTSSTSSGAATGGGGKDAAVGGASGGAKGDGKAVEIVGTCRPAKFWL